MLFLSLQTWADNLLAGTYHLLVDGLARLFYGLVWGVMYALSIIITIIETGFYLFAGINTIGYRDSEGNQRVGYIIDAFLGNAQIFSAYLQLAIIAFVVMLVLAVLKIIKQDYIDKAGPRSKGPIFRNLVISFILYISIPPLFMILTSVSSILALSVYRAFGGGTDLIADILLKNSFGWKTTSTDSIAPYDVLYVGEQSFMNLSGSNLFYSQHYLPKYGNDGLGNDGYQLLRDKSRESWSLPNTELGYGGNELITAERAESVTFYWYTYFIGAVVIVSMLFNMIMAMIGRVYRIVVLYVVAPVSIAQIVADDGAKFKKWQNSTISEFLKVVSSIITFMVFVIMIGAINSIDFSSIYAGGETAGLINEGAATIIGGAGVTQNLSMFMSTGGVSMFSSTMLNIFNATMKIFFILAGAQVIKEIDPLVTELVTGASGTSNSNQSVASAMKSTAKIGALAAGAAIGVAAKGVGKVAKGVANKTENKDMQKEKDTKINEEAEKEIKKNNGQDAASTPDDKKVEAPVSPSSGDGNTVKDADTATDTGGDQTETDAATDPVGGGINQDNSIETGTESNDDKAEQTKSTETPVAKEPKERNTKNLTGIVATGLDKMKSGVDTLKERNKENKIKRAAKKQARKDSKSQKRAEINRLNTEKNRGKLNRTLRSLGRGATATAKLIGKPLDRAAGLAVKGTAGVLKTTGKILQRGAVAALSITPMGKSAMNDFKTFAQKNQKHKQKLREAKEKEVRNLKVQQTVLPAVAKQMEEKVTASGKTLKVADKNLLEAETTYKKASEHRVVSERELASSQSGLIDLEREENASLLDVNNAANRRELIKDEARRNEDEYGSKLINNDVYSKRKQSIDGRLSGAEEDIKTRRAKYESIKNRRNEELVNVSKKQKEVEDFKKNEINAEKQLRQRRQERQSVHATHHKNIEKKTEVDAKLAKLKINEGAKGTTK